MDAVKDSEKIKSLQNSTRLEILQKLAEQPSYPSAIAKELDLDKQKTYYHINKLKEAGLIEKTREEKKSGGTATFYKTKKDKLKIDLLGNNTTKNQKTKLNKILDNFYTDNVFEGMIVTGSPDEHGPDQVRARDGHLTGEIGLKLGQTGEPGDKNIWLDTELQSKNKFNESMILLGGVLTNTVTKKYNENFPAKFAGESFPYRKIKTPENTYTSPNIGVIAKAEHPDFDDKSLFLVAGIRNKGTYSAVKAFQDLENFSSFYESGKNYIVVKGLDLNGDGEIDDYEQVE